jgi:hypothetical protein
VKPVYVSVGHKIDLDTAVGWTLACCRGLRIPEPARLAHQAAGGKLIPQKPAGNANGQAAPKHGKIR